MSEVPITERRPETVCIVAMGLSSATYLRAASHVGDYRKVADEVWAINSMGGVIQHDRLFHMDDLLVQEIRAAAKPKSSVAGTLSWLRTHPGPLYTSTPYPARYPGSIAYPIKAVADDLKILYFNGTAAYAIAYAIHLRVKRMWLFGLDYTYPDAHKAERGRACVEFWLGYATHLGIGISVPNTTTLLDSYDPQVLYGYDGVDVEIVENEDGYNFTFTPKETLPTAEEMERRYKFHPSAQEREGEVHEVDQARKGSGVRAPRDLDNEVSGEPGASIDAGGCGGVRDSERVWPGGGGKLREAPTGTTKPVGRAVRKAIDEGG